MSIECRSVFFRKYKEKIKGSLLCSHPLHVHTGQVVMGRESVWGSVLVSELASPRCIWGSGVICLSYPRTELLLAGRRADHRRGSYLRVWNVGQLHHETNCTPIQLNQSQKASLSQYITSFKIFVTSLCPSHLSSSKHTRKKCLCVTHSHLDASRKRLFTNISHTTMTDFYVHSLHSILRCSMVVVGSAKALSSHWWEPAVTTDSPTRLQGSPAWQAHHCSRTQLGNHSVPHAEKPLFLIDLSTCPSLHPFQVQWETEECKSPGVQCQ